MEKSIMDVLKLGRVTHVITRNGVRLMGNLKKVDKEKMLLQLEYEDNSGLHEYLVNLHNCDFCTQTSH